MKCSNPSVSKCCTPEMDCFVNSPEHYNCFLVWSHFNKDSELTLHEVGELLDLSYESIRQIEVRALAKYSAAIGVMKVRKCTTCLILKPIEAFRKNNQITTGYTTKCKGCHSNSNRVLYHKIPSALRTTRK